MIDTMKLTLVTLFFSTLGCAVGEEGMEGEELNTTRRAHLMLTVAKSDPGRVDVVLTDYPGVERPRVMELFVSFDGALDFVGGSRGDAADQSGKAVVIQQPSPGKIRVVVYGVGNANPIGLGTLASLRFDVEGPGLVELRSEQPVFAPTASNSGLLLGDPVRIEHQ